jgi:RNA polymerase sigma-70 factor (ECF subfamily)
LDFNDEKWRSWNQLIRQTREGDRGAYERLLVEISPLVQRYVAKRVFDSQYVEDVFQEVLLSFHKALHTYRTELPFAPWFFAVIRNATWTALVKNRKFAEREIPTEDFTPFAAAEEGEEEGDDRLRGALESLPAIYRQAVEMLKFRGMRVEAAAKELGISKIALRVRAHRGYNLLRKHLIGQRQEGKK